MEDVCVSMHLTSNYKTTQYFLFLQRDILCSWTSNFVEVIICRVMSRKASVLVPASCGHSRSGFQYCCVRHGYETLFRLYESYESTVILQTQDTLSSSCIFIKWVEKMSQIFAERIEFRGTTVYFREQLCYLCSSFICFSYK